MTKQSTTFSNDVDDILHEAQELFRRAATLTGDQAEKLRDEGMQLLDNALTSIKKIPRNTMAVSKEAIASADNFVKENPWQTIATVAGISLLVGIILGRK